MRPLKDNISVSLDIDIISDLKLLAEMDDRNLSAYLNHLLKRHVVKNAERLNEYKDRGKQGTD